MTLALDLKVTETGFFPKHIGVGDSSVKRRERVREREGGREIAKGVLLSADMQDGYNFPSHIVCTDLHPDIEWWYDDKRAVTLLPFWMRQL